MLVNTNPTTPDQGPTRECLESRLRPLFLWLRKEGFGEDVAWAAVSAAWCKAIAYLNDGRALSLKCRLTWLHDIAYWAALDEVRRLKAKHSVDPTVLEKMPRPETPQADQTLSARVCAEVERLSERQRQAVQCVIFRGMSYRAAAEEIGVSASTLRVCLQAALRKLASALGDVFSAAKSTQSTSVHRAAKS